MNLDPDDIRFFWGAMALALGLILVGIALLKGEQIVGHVRKWMKRRVA